VMLTGGPRGKKGRTRYKNARIIAAGVDRVAIDSYGLSIMGRGHNSVAHISQASGVIEIPSAPDAAAGARPATGTSDWRSVGLVEATL